MERVRSETCMQSAALKVAAWCSKKRNGRGIHNPKIPSIMGSPEPYSDSGSNTATQPLPSNFSWSPCCTSEKSCQPQFAGQLVQCTQPMLWKIPAAKPHPPHLWGTHRSPREQQTVWQQKERSMTEAASRWAALMLPPVSRNESLTKEPMAQLMKWGFLACLGRIDVNWSHHDICPFPWVQVKPLSQMHVKPNSIHLLLWKCIIGRQNRGLQSTVTTNIVTVLWIDARVGNPFEWHDKFYLSRKLPR